MGLLNAWACWRLRRRIKRAERRMNFNHRLLETLIWLVERWKKAETELNPPPAIMKKIKPRPKRKAR
jgi:hypothetical protein